MAQNFLYMFEFVVDDLMITRQNLCAPEEYPTCAEISFRSSVFVSVCDREYGACVHPSQPKCGKCCLFTLESPITDKDRLQVHIYKKRTDRCKFLIGLTDLAVKPIFDRVHESFNAENANWEKILHDHVADLPKMKSPHKSVLDNCACYEQAMSRREQWCPTSELSKRLLPLFNLCKLQTGNIVLIMRLVCNGPAIVSTFPFNRVCSRNPTCPPCPPCPPPANDEGECNGNGGASVSATGGPMDKCKKCCRSNCRSPSPPVCVQPDPCLKNEVEVQPKCLRYFACNLDKLCPCDYCEDEFDRECPTVPSKRRALSVIEQRLKPCGPCGAVPALPGHVLVKMQQEKEAKYKEKKEKESMEKKDKSEGKKKNKKRQSGGGVFCDVNQCAGSSNTYENRSPDYEACCDAARKRAIRKLRHLLVKYNIQID